MKFNKARLYTLLDAGELKIGSKGYFANDVAELADYLDDEAELETLAEVNKEEAVGTKCFKSDKKEGWYRFFYFLESPKLTEVEKLARKKEQTEDFEVFNERRKNSALLEKSRYSYINNNCKRLYSVARLLSRVKYLDEGMAEVLSDSIEDIAATIQENCKTELEDDEYDSSEDEE